MATSSTHAAEGDERTPRDNDLPPIDVQHPTPIETMGVVVHCSDKDVPEYASKRVPSYEHVSHIKDSPFYIPTKIGLPLWLRFHPPQLSDSDNKRQNIWAEILTVRISTVDLYDNAKNQNRPAIWTDPLEGSKLVMRKDKFNLIPQHLEVICEFCMQTADRTDAPSGKGNDDRDKSVQKEWFEQAATRDKFEVFYRRYRAKRAKKDRKWRNLPSPYDTARLGRDFATIPHDGIWKAQNDKVVGIKRKSLEPEVLSRIKLPRKAKAAKTGR